MWLPVLRRRQGQRAQDQGWAPRGHNWARGGCPWHPRPAALAPRTGPRAAGAKRLRERGCTPVLPVLQVHPQHDCKCRGHPSGKNQIHELLAYVIYTI